MSALSIARFIQEHYPEYFSIETYRADRCVTVHKKDGAWGIFSNFARTPLVVNGVLFKNAEHLYQCMKFQDPETVCRIYAAGNPKMPAKRCEKEGRRRADWGEMLLDAMKFCLMTKYEQSPEFRAKLKESEGFFIVEDQTTFPKKNPDAWGVKLRGEDFVGPNLLGRFLMELRDNGELSYKLPEDAFAFIQYLK